VRVTGVVVDRIHNISPRNIWSAERESEIAASLEARRTLPPGGKIREWVEEDVLDLHGLFVEDTLVWIIAVLDTLHVLPL
jgi:hypothetical protein